MAEAAMNRGHRALKLKVGFGADTDLANLAVLRGIVGTGMLAADANQGWSIEQALEMMPRLHEFHLRWLEEPIRADRPRQEWRRLHASAGMPLAAGENIASRESFEHVLAEDVLGARTLVRPMPTKRTAAMNFYVSFQCAAKIFLENPGSN